jgi:hypothetical protein
MVSLGDQFSNPNTASQKTEIIFVEDFDSEFDNEFIENQLSGYLKSLFGDLI